MIKDIFTTPIGVYELNVDCRKIERYILDMKEKESEGRTISNVGGYQSNPLDLEDKNFKPFIDELFKKLEDYVSIFKVPFKVKLFDYWFNVNNFKDNNKLHNHSGAFVSGAYYVRVPENSGKIFFQNSKTLKDKCSHTKMLGDYNKYRSDHFNITPKENLLVLFPSWLDHLVESNQTHEDRISMSFNLILTAE